MKLAKNETKNSKKLAVIIAAPVAVIIVLLTLVDLSKPNRSVASFCKEYKNQMSQLPATKGEGYNVRVFPGKISSDPKVFKNAFSALESVAPKDIEPDISTLRKVFESIDKDPANAVSASIDGLSAESNVTKYVEDNCR